eukprot:6024789-Amphidinium_carterae.1
MSYHVIPPIYRNMMRFHLMPHGRGFALSTLSQPHFSSTLTEWRQVRLGLSAGSMRGSCLTLFWALSSPLEAKPEWDIGEHENHAAMQ